SARYNWFIGDRTTFVANTFFDTYNNAEMLWSFGLNSQRSTRGSVFVGMRQIEGGTQLKSQILTASYSYAMTPKWITTFGTAYDFGENQSRGETFTFTRVGADFLVHISGVIDPTKNNVGFGISV